MHGSIMTPQEEQKLEQAITDSSAIIESPVVPETLKPTIGLCTIPRRKIDPPPPEREPEPPEPIHRRVQAYAFDPSFSGSFATYEFNGVTTACSQNGTASIIRCSEARFWRGRPAMRSTM
jgi:hypothetical protein